MTWYRWWSTADETEGMARRERLMILTEALIFHGSKDILICGCYGRDPWLLSGRVPASPKTERRVTVSHEMDWVSACKEVTGIKSKDQIRLL